MRAFLVALLAGVFLLGNPTGASAATPCTGTPTTYNHVVVWMLENHAFSQSRGVMPYLDGLANQCAYLTHHKALTHPSLPNYIALTSGQTHGITTDGGPSSLGFSAPNIFSQVSEWRLFAQNMSVPCKLTDGPKNYVVHHNPATYYTNIRSECNQWDVPMLRLADSVGGLPPFTMVVPDRCHDGHKNSCPGGGTLTSQAKQADDYLKATLPTILNGGTYQAGHTLVIITWDEGKGTNQTVYTVMVGPSLHGQVITTSITHYSILRFIESKLGVPCLLNACSAPMFSLP